MPVVQHIYGIVQSEMNSVGGGIPSCGWSWPRSFGGAIGLERELKHRPAGLRTNLFILSWRGYVHPPLG